MSAFIKIFIYNLHGKSILSIIVSAYKKPCQLKSPTVELTECYRIRIQSCDALSNQKCQHYASMAIGHV